MRALQGKGLSYDQYWSLHEAKKSLGTFSGEHCIECFYLLNFFLHHLGNNIFSQNSKCPSGNLLWIILSPGYCTYAFSRLYLFRFFNNFIVKAYIVVLC